MTTMTRILRTVAALAAAVFLASSVSAQTTLTNTTLAAAISNANDQVMTLTAVTNFSATSAQGQTYAFMDREVVGLRAINTTTKVVQITRGLFSTRATGHANGAKVWFIDASVSPIALQQIDRAGACSTAGSADLSQDGRYSPVFNTVYGNAFTCANSTWVPYGLLLGQPPGCSVTQATNRTTGVTCQGTFGVITTNNASLAAEATADFTVTNASVAISDAIEVSQRSGSNGGGTIVSVSAVAAGSFNIRVHNGNVAAGTAETGAILINFVVHKPAP